MADTDYALYKFSAKCQAPDIAVVHCLRALAQWAEKHRHPQIGWGGTGEKEWLESNRTIVLRFTTPGYREAFIRKAEQLLPPQAWKCMSKSDDDPASRRRTQH